VTLAGKHLSVDESRQDFEWSGGIDDLEFDVEVLSDAPEGFVVLKYDVYIERVRVAKLRIDLDISARTTAAEQRTASTTPARSAFASYASKDRLRVLDRVSAIEINAGIEVFQDCLSLRPSEQWKPRLRQEILDRDRFLLFWSHHAGASPWVEWEWTTALEQKGVDAFEVHPLEPVQEAPPPERLRNIFHRSVRAVLLGEAGWLARMRKISRSAG
jgi:hypothetical protein